MCYSDGNGVWCLGASWQILTRLHGVCYRGQLRDLEEEADCWVRTWAELDTLSRPAYKPLVAVVKKDLIASFYISLHVVIMRGKKMI